MKNKKNIFTYNGCYFYSDVYIDFLAMIKSQHKNAGKPFPNTRNK